MSSTPRLRARIARLYDRLNLLGLVGSLICLLGAGPTSASAQSTPAGETGTVTGRVLNASSGNYLSKARVSVEGTALETLSSEFGDYTLKDVPVGSVSIRAQFTGLPAKVVTATVLAGQEIHQDIEMKSTDGTVVLDTFTVAADRFRNAREIAINEERNSVNIKNVVSVDQFGDIPNNNVGEFVKFLPGVQVSYGAFGGNSQGYSESDASGISVRGFGPEDTAVMIDGMPVSNATPGTLSRQVGLDQLSINNAARVELIKVATADMPNNSIGGSINLITKSAFEYVKPVYTARVFFNFSSLNTSLGKTPGPVNDRTFKTTPALEFSVTQPISKKLGISFTGYAANEFNQSYTQTPVYTTTGTFTNSAGAVVSLSNPILNRVQVADIPRLTERRSGNLRLDWKPTSAQLLRANFQYSTYESVEAQRNLDIRPTIAAGVDWDATKTIGTTANSTLDMVVRTRDKVGATKSGQLTYEYNWGGWTVSAGGSYSESTGDYRDRENGHFSEVGLKLNPAQITLTGIGADGIPGKINTFARTTGVATDYTNLANWGFDNTVARSGEAFSRNKVGLYRLDVSRDLSFIPWLRGNPLSLRFGGRRDQEKTEKSGIGTNYAEILNPGKSYLVADILDTNYLGQSPGFGLPAQQWASTYKLFELDQKLDLFYAPTDGAEAIANYNSYAGQQKSLTDTKDAMYALLAGTLFRNRLSYNFGARQESSKREGRGPFIDSKWNYAKNSDGIVYTDAFYKTGVKFDSSNSVRTNADGTTTTITNFLSDTALLSRLTAAGVKFPDHLYGPVASSLESRKLNLVANKPVHAKQEGDPSLSFSTAYKLTEKIDLKAAWSRSFGLPPLESGTSGIVSAGNSFTINENVPVAADGTRGSITVANPNIKPQTATNWDFEVGYYTNSGGKFSANYYYKSVTDQIVSFSSFSGTPEFDLVLPSLGLDPADYADWRLTTSTNSHGTQNTHGVELQVIQDFAFLGEFGRRFSGFISWSTKSLGQPATVAPVTITSPAGTPITITPTVSTIRKTANKFGGAGLQYADRRFVAQIRATYRNDNEIAQSSLANGNILRRFEPEETRVDLNFSYFISRRYNLFASGRDVFNSERKEINRDDQGLLAPYASTFKYKQIGVQWSVGVSGRF